MTSTFSEAVSAILDALDNEELQGIGDENDYYFTIGQLLGTALLSLMDGVIDRDNVEAAVTGLEEAVL